MQPGDVLSLTIYRRTIADAAAPGKGLADFGVNGYINGVVQSMSPAITEIAALADSKGTAYRLDVTLPGSAGIIAVRAAAATGTDIVWPEFEFEVQAYDVDSIHDLVVKPTTGTTATSVPDTDLALTFDANRYHDVSITKVDAAGAPIDLSGYNNGRFNVWDKGHTGAVYSVAVASMTVGGLITVVVPENAAFFSFITTAIAAGLDTTTLYWDIVADKAATASKSQNLARGTINLRRFEGAA